MGRLGTKPANAGSRICDMDSALVAEFAKLRRMATEDLKIVERQITLTPANDTGAV